MKATNFRRPRTGDAKLRVQFRCGWVSRHEYTAAQLRWTDTNDDWDIIGAEYADKGRAA